MAYHIEGKDEKVKLLKLALQKQDYHLAAQILVYGLLRASQNPKDYSVEKKDDKPRGRA